LKDGKIVLEKYFGTFTQDSLWYWASAGKSLTSTLVGIAQQDKLLNINDLSSKYLGKGWTSETAAKEDLITIRHQLTMTTGLDDSGSKDCTIPSCFTYKADAGTRWAYHNGPYTILDKVIEKASGLTINQFHTAKLRSKIGMNGLYIQLGENNVYFSNPRSMARYGLLILNKGTWNTSKVLDDVAYFSAAINTSQQLNKSYGYLWWLNGKASFMIPTLQTVFQGALTSEAPADMFSALGKNGQIINIVPSQNLVVIRMGNSDGSPVPIVFVNEIWKNLNKVICKSTPTTELTTNQFELFPNPASDVINIQNDVQLSDIQVFNGIGQAVSVSLNDHELSIQHLPKGIYFLKMGGVVKHFVKE
jgi:CubicO group peptidase (beta-lactamase class C family)